MSNKLEEGNSFLETFVEELAVLAKKHNVYLNSTCLGKTPFLEIGLMDEGSPSTCFLQYTSGGKIHSYWLSEDMPEPYLKTMGLAKIMRESGTVESHVERALKNQELVFGISNFVDKEDKNGAVLS
ncbi:MAG: hypothetical protein KDH96_04080 [Candidatus Riesia sp.]|nr:hypothetical protein [Candidatus Riesia sp.]